MQVDTSTLVCAGLGALFALAAAVWFGYKRGFGDGVLRTLTVQAKLKRLKRECKQLQEELCDADTR